MHGFPVHPLPEVLGVDGQGWDLDWAPRSRILPHRPRYERPYRTGVSGAQTDLRGVAHAIQYRKLGSHPDEALEQQGPSLADRIETAERQLNDHAVIMANQTSSIAGLANDVRRLAATIQEQQNQLAALRTTIQSIGTYYSSDSTRGGQS
jgi:hypothetical protein